MTSAVISNGLNKPLLVEILLIKNYLSMVRCTRRALPLTDSFLLLYSWKSGAYSCCQVSYREGYSCYNLYVASPIPATGGGEDMEYIISFLLSVGASIVAVYIGKWLNRK